MRRNRKVDPLWGAKAVIRFRDLGTDDAAGGVTTVMRTVLDCARDLSLGRPWRSRTPLCGTG